MIVARGEQKVTRTLVETGHECPSKISHSPREKET